MVPDIPAEGRVREEPETQSRSGLSHPGCSEGELFSGRSVIPEPRGEPETDVLRHQPPRTKRRASHETDDFPNNSFTEAIVTPCSLKVNASREHLKDPVQAGKALKGAKAH